MQLNTAEIRAIITGIEQTYPVDRWVLGGMHVWFFLRVRLYFALFFRGRSARFPSLGQSALSGKTSMAVKKASAAVSFMRTTLRDSRGNITKFDRADILFLSYSAHRVLLDGAWYDRFCDPFADVFERRGMTTVLLELAPFGEYRVPRHRPSRLIQPRVDCSLFQGLVMRYREAADDSLEGFGDFVREVAERYPGIQVPSRKILHADVASVTVLRKYFIRVLERVRPELVMIAEYYNSVASALILACRDAGIPTVDIQHGIQGHDHFAYGAWSRVPQGGYEMFPSVFWCWSARELETILEWSAPLLTAGVPYAGGDLWANMWTDAASPVVMKYDAEILEFQRSLGSRPLILFTPGLAEDLSDRIVTAIAESQDRYFWLIRLHPSMTGVQENVERILRSAGARNYDVRLATEFPLQAWLRHVAANVTAYSTTVIDAARFGVPSVITDRAALSMFEEELSSGIATTAFDADELLHVLSRAVAHERPREVREQAPGVDNAAVVDSFLGMMRTRFSSGVRT